MPAPTNRDVPRGEGSADPTIAVSETFTPAAITVRPLTTQIEQLREALGAAAGSLASGLQTTAAIKNRMEQRKDRVVAEQEEEVREINRAKTLEVEVATERTVRLAKSAIQDMLLDPRSENPEWLLQQSTVRFQNSTVPQERDQWFSLIQESLQRREVIRRDVARDRAEDLGYAALTADNVVSAAAAELAADPQLEAELIGDGKDIPSRVENWVLSAVRDADPDIFDIPDDAPDRAERVKNRDTLIAKIINASMPVTNRLVGKYLKQVNGEDELIASRKLDGMFASALTGDLVDGPTMTQGVQEVRQVLLGHLPDPSAQELIQGSVARGLASAASGHLEKDVPLRRKAALAITRAAGLTDTESAVLLQKFEDELRRDVVGGAEDAVKERILQLSRPQIDQDPESPTFGQFTSTRADPSVAQLMALPDPESGESMYMQAGREYLSSLGIPLESEDPLIAQVFDRITDLERAALGGMRDDIRKGNQLRAFLTNSSGGSSDVAWEVSAANLSQGAGMTLDSLVRVATTVSESERAEVMSWEGQRLENVPETRNQRAQVWTSLALEHNVADKYTPSPDLIERLSNDWVQGDAEAMWNAMSYFRGVGNKHMFLQDFSKKAGPNARIALEIANHTHFQSRKPVQWAETVARAKTIINDTELIDSETRTKRIAVDEAGRRIFVKNEDGSRTYLSRQDQFLQLLFGAMAQSQVLADPQGIHPDQKFEKIIGIPDNDRSLFRRLISAGARAAYQSATFGFPAAIREIREGDPLMAVASLVFPAEAGAFAEPDPPLAVDIPPADIEASLRNAIQGIGDLNYQNIIDVGFGFMASGMPPEEAAIATVSFMGDRGLRVADLGSGPKIIFDPRGGLGPNALNFKELSLDVQAWLDSPLPDLDTIRGLNADFGDPTWHAPDFVAVKFMDIPHLLYPNRFGDPNNVRTQPLQWRLASEDASWIPGAQAGGMPLLFLTQTGSPEWVPMIDPRTGGVLVGYNWSEIDPSTGRRPDLNRVIPQHARTPFGTRPILSLDIKR